MGGVDVLSIRHVLVRRRLWEEGRGWEVSDLYLRLKKGLMQNVNFSKNYGAIMYYSSIHRKGHEIKLSVCPKSRVTIPQGSAPCCNRVEHGVSRQPHSRYHKFG